jgi:L-alanine-DL-glutamate epimerase-like enolase superfamily enzyme
MSCGEEMSHPMKITDVEIIPLGYPIDDFPPRQRSFALVKISTDEGIVGWGEASDSYGHSAPLTVRALIDEIFRWRLVDQDPLSVALLPQIRERMYITLGEHGLPMQTLSAIDIALWDIRGKVEQKPIAALLGERRHTVALYAAGKPEFRLSGEEYCRAVLGELLNRGVQAVKVRTGHEVHWDEKFLHQVHAALPPGVALLVDGYFNYTPVSALRIGRVLEEIGAMGFEEPLHPRGLREIARLAAKLQVPLAYGEHCSTLGDFRDLIAAEAVGIAEPDATICGGITEMIRIGVLCEAFGLDVIPHCGGLTAIGLAANLHAAAALPSCRYFEFDARPEQPLRDLMAAGAPFGLDKVTDGRMPIPSGPGLGVEINEEVFAAYPYRIDEQIARSFPAYGTPHV